MLLHRDLDEVLVSELCGLTAWSLRSDIFESLFALNEQCLDLLAEEALTQPGQGSLLLRQVGEIWQTLDSAARRRASACPYLLVDVGFADPDRWLWTEGQHVSDAAELAYNTFFTVPRAPFVARQVFIYAWHLARSKNAVVQLLLGMSHQCSQLIRTCTLPQMHELAERHSDWMRPRWPTRVKVWRQLLLAAASGEVVALENARMHGLQLLAAECRNAVLLSSKGGGGLDFRL
jgi:hypothetical protein